MLSISAFRLVVCSSAHLAHARMQFVHKLAQLISPKPDASAGDEEQIEVSRIEGTIWNAVLAADQTLVKQLCEHDNSVVEQRGAVGELPIHMSADSARTARETTLIRATPFSSVSPVSLRCRCFLYNSPAHLELAKWIMNHYPHTITSTYLGTEYTGENILHIAIINQDFKTVQELVERGHEALLTARATGGFFSRGKACYYGEYPLAFACCTNQPEIASFLLDHGADINCADSNGNTILHLLVIHNLPEMYTFVKNEYKRRVKGEGDKLTMDESNDHIKPPSSAPTTDLWLRLNNDGLTPFCLAAKLNVKDMFSFILDEMKQLQWKFGPVSCILYPLNELDLAIDSSITDASSPSGSGAGMGASAGKDDPPVHPGALELIMNEGNIDLLMHPRMIDLVSQKWNKFAQRIFHQRFRQVLAYLCFFTLTTIVRQTVHHIYEKEDAMAAERDAMLARGETLPAGPASNGAQYLPWAYFIYCYPPLLWAMELAVLAGAYYKGAKEFAEMWRSGVREYFSSSGSALLENSLSCLFCGCIFIVFLLSLIGSPMQSAVLAMASIAGWSYIFFFLLAFRLTGPMVVMIHQMLTNDVLRFCLIYLVFLMGFAQAFFVLFESVGYAGFITSVKTMFVAMLGDFELDQFADTPYTAVSVGLLVVYVVTITILLLNLLIAMMGDTYEKINESSTSQWHLERARIIFAIENEMTSEERNSTENKYWTSVKGERFLQVLEVNPDHFKSEKSKKDDGGEKAETDK
jgi:ankyrin repeat protein